jgi:hypothetical protein
LGFSFVKKEKRNPCFESNLNNNMSSSQHSSKKRSKKKKKNKDVTFEKKQASKHSRKKRIEKEKTTLPDGKTLDNSTWDALLLNSFNFDYETGGAFVRKPLEFLKDVQRGGDEMLIRGRNQNAKMTGLFPPPAIQTKNSNNKGNNGSSDDDSDDESDIEEEKGQARKHKVKTDVIVQIAGKMAREEHRGYRDMPLFAPLSVINHMISPSVSWYFTYFLTLIYMVCFMCFTSLAFQIYVIYANASDQNMSMLSYLESVSTPLRWMTPVELASSAVPIWVANTALNVICCAWVPFIYRGWVHRIEQTTNAESRVFDNKSIDNPHRGDQGIGNPQARDLIEKTPLELIELGHQEDAENNFDVPQSLRSIHVPEGLIVDIHIGENENSLEPNDNNINFDRAAEYVDHSTKKALDTMDNLNRNKKYFGRFASWFLFVFLLASYAAVQYVAYVLISTPNNEWLFLSVSIAMVLFTVLWNTLAQISTGWEGYRTKSAVAKSYFFKTTLFRICSRVVLYSFSMFYYFNNSGQCPYDLLGQMYLTTMPVDISSFFASSIAIVALHRFVVDHCCRKSRDTHNKFMPDFVLAEELDTLLDNSFVLVCGSTVLFLMPWCMIIVLGFQWLFVRIEIKYFIRPVAKHNNTFIHPITIMTMIQIAVALVVLPIGSIWIFYGYATNCTSTILKIIP